MQGDQVTEILTGAQKTMLEKVRKGRVAGFTVKSLRELFVLFPGWAVNPLRAYVPSAEYNIIERVDGLGAAMHAVDAAIEIWDLRGAKNEVGEQSTLLAYAREKAESIRAVLLRVATDRAVIASVGPKGPKPRAPEYVVTDVSDVFEAAPDGSDPQFGVSFRVLVNVPVTDITSPDGWTFRLITAYSVVRSESYRTLTQWIEEASVCSDLMQRVNEMLGTEPYVPTDQRVRDDFNVGTCPACFGRFKIRAHGDSEHMVLHGYLRPGYGSINGRCFGVDYEPYELSPDGTVAFREVIATMVANAAQRVANWQDGTIVSFLDLRGHFGPQKVTHTPESPRWKRIVEWALGYATRDHASLVDTHSMLTGYIDKWVLAPAKIKRAPTT